MKHRSTHLREVQAVQRMTLLFHLLNGSRFLLHPLGFLSEIQVQDGNSTSLNVGLRQRVHHQHHPHRPLALPVSRYSVEQVVRVQAFAPLIRRDPRLHHQLDVIQVPLQTTVDVSGQQVLEVFSLRQQLAAGQSRYGVRVRQVQLKIHDVAFLKGLFGVLWDVVPHACVRNMNSAIEIRGRVSFYSPQERVELTLLKDRQSETAKMTSNTNIGI